MAKSIGALIKSVPTDLNNSSLLPTMEENFLIFSPSRVTLGPVNALKTGESEISLNTGPVNVSPGQPDSWSYKAWALVDLPCKRIYAFKILITKILNGKGYACLGYAPCPEYGDFYNKTCAIHYAVETIRFPVLEPYASPEVILDDTFDDFVLEVPKPIAVVPSGLPSLIGTGLPAQLVVPEELNQCLTSIDNSLSCLATSIEQLVEILKLSRYWKQGDIYLA